MSRPGHLAGRPRSGGTLTAILVDGVPTSRHPLRSTWEGMVARCHRPTATAYPWYGARGIAVCARWRESFAAFVADVGPKPTPKHSLDRVERDGNYEPGNVRWATKATQNANRRRSYDALNRFRGAFDAPDRVIRQAWPDFGKSNDVTLLAAYDVLDDLVAEFGPVGEDFDDRCLAFGWGFDG